MDNEKKIGMVIVLVAFFVVASLIVMYTLKPTKSLVEDVVVYDNGVDKFNIKKIKDNNTITSRIEIFFKGSPRPFYINTRYGPDELEDFPSAWDKKDILNKELVYITIDPDKNLTGKAVIAALELTYGISDKYFYGIPTIGAVTKDYNKNPVITCNNVNESLGVIYLKLDKKSEVASENGCVVISGKEEEDLIKGADKVFLQLLNILRK